jgi:16S rRNA (adenine1518-N6/adenine1519-N6)-dimethyltransferase
MKAKKSLGQNFLKSEIALRKIVEAGEIKKSDIVLEIGPGKGALTAKLLEKAKTVIAVEKDNELFEFLKTKFAKEIETNTLVLVCEDILEFDIAKVVRQDLTTYKVIANIPYNITGAILKKFLTAKNQPESMILMVQHEVAKRIVARDPRHGGAGGKESLLSISVKAYGEPKIIMKVDKRYFSPSPKVDSAIIAIRNISRKLFLPPPLDKGRTEEGSRNSDPLPTSPLLRGRGIGEAKFWEIVKAGFAHKRKKLSSNLKGVCQRDTLTALGNKRAEDLSLEDWISLAKA